jgi:hypothetical protein
MNSKDKMLVHRVKIGSIENSKQQAEAKAL